MLSSAFSYLPQPAAKPASTENPAVAKLKRCISTAGLRVRYVQLLEETDTVEQKVAKLMKVLRDAGLQGKFFSLYGCDNST